MKVKTLHFYVMVTMMYGNCVVLVIFRICHYSPFFVADLSVTKPAAVVVLAKSCVQ